MSYKVKLREKKINGGKKSLYLDFYPPIPLKPSHYKKNKKGELITTTRREFLGSYIFEKPKNQLERNENEQKLRIAREIRRIRENNLNKPEIYTEDEKEKLRLKELGELNFVLYFEKLMNKRTGSNYSNWRSTYNYLKMFTNGSLKFNEIDVIKLEEFRDFLLTTNSIRSKKVNLSQNSAVSYFNKVKATLKQAFKEGLLQVDVNSRVSSIKTVETRRAFLTEEELNKLIKTPCRNKLIKQVALFSALTGLRFSDIKKLKWKEVEVIKDVGIFINFTQKKTKGIEVLPISKQALKLMGERRELDNSIFEGLKYSAYNNKDLYNWIENAGITKDITFHSFRHSFATLQLLKETDLYTVSKLLGHKDLKTTQIYAKVVDKTKQKAVNKIHLDFANYED